jgi:TRAP-type mannitol/chloroaromatic compound transport system permease large subunit
MSAQGIAITVLLISFLVMILLRFPIAYAVALSSLLCLLTQGLPLTTICQQMVKGISSFSLMAVPFFITMGVLMGTGGISEKLIALANACVGWMTGGMAMPLRYNNDKQKKPLFSRGLSVCRLLFNSFSKLKIDENYKEKRRLFY